MADPQLTNVVAVGGNAISAFLSWRLSATNACDVTLVWKNGFDAVAQYGLSFKCVETGVQTTCTQSLTDAIGRRHLETKGSSRDKVC